MVRSEIPTLERAINQHPDLSDNRVWLRLLLVTGLGIAIALGLTWFMHNLIQSGQQRLDETERAQMLAFVRDQRNETSKRKTLKPKRPVANQAPPTPATPQSSSDNMDQAQGLALEALPDANLDMSAGGIGIADSDSDYLPIVKVAPMYPRYAANKHIEGTCMVTYTVTTKGTTRDVRVVPGQCTHQVFEKVSVKAAQKFKYKPRTVDGETIEVHGVKNRFYFRLDKDDA